MRYIIGNGIIYDGNIFYPQGSILIDQSEIEQVGPCEKISAEGIEFIDVQGRLIIPGLLNPHFHFYSSLSPGLSPLKSPKNFTEVLKYFWWPLDQSLDEESIYYSTLLGAMESVKHGVTMIFDHHASMNYISGSLNIIKQACQLMGIKALLCYEISNRLNHLCLDQQIEENLNFHQQNKDSGWCKGILGLHANFTLDSFNLEQIKSDFPENIPVHIHCGEDRCDLQYCIEQGFKGPVDRLNHYKLLSPGSILAHCVHLSDRDVSLIKHFNPVVVSNPESNFNNGVGEFNPEIIKRYLVGTDSMSADMIATHRFHYLTANNSSLPQMGNLMFSHRNSIQQKYFPNTGLLEPGYKADLAVLDYIPCQQVDLDNVISHLLFGAKTGSTYLTVSDGKIIYAQHNFTNINEQEIYAQAMKVGEKLKQRFLKCQI